MSSEQATVHPGTPVVAAAMSLPEVARGRFEHHVL